MAPKQLNHKSEILKSGSNGLAMVDYPIYNPNNNNRRHSLAYNYIEKLAFNLFGLLGDIHGRILSRPWTHV